MGNLSQGTVKGECWFPLVHADYNADCQYCGLKCLV